MSKLKKYLLFTFISTLIISLIGAHDYNTGHIGGLMGFSYSLSISMLIPTIGAFIAGADFKKMGWNPKFTQNVKPFLFAWLVPTVLTLLGAGLYFMVFPDDLVTSWDYYKDIEPEIYEEAIASGESYTGRVVKEIFNSFSPFEFIAIFYGLAEEIGWRGFMFPELKKSYGKIKGLIIGGIIHGVWHFPAMFLVGYQYGTDYIGAPLLGPPVFCIFTISTGIITDYLYRKSGTIWITGFFHAMINTNFNSTLIRGNEHYERNIFGPGEVGLISVLPLAFTAAAILWYESKQEFIIEEEEILEETLIE